MAIAYGIDRFRGSLSDLVFYTRNKKQVVRKKATVYRLSEKSIKTGRDFGQASRNASYLRKNLKVLVKGYGNDDFHNRLNSAYISIFNSISSEKAGYKQIRDGNIASLKGFEFNTKTCLQHLLNVHPELCINDKESLKVVLFSGNTQSPITWMPKAAEAKIQIMAFSYDIDEGGQYERIRMNDLTIPAGQTIFSKKSISVPIDLSGEKALIIGIGIHFNFTIGDSRSWDKRYFACKITNAVHLIDGQEVKYTAPPVIKIDDPDECCVGEWVDED